jgi:cell division protein FtsQ
VRAGGERRWRLVRARPEAVPASVRRFHERIRRRRLRSVVPFLIGGGVLVLLGLLAWVVWGTSVLGVRDVAVAGVDIVTPDDVRAAAAIAPGTPLARVDTDAVAARVAALPAVDSVVVSRSLPGTVHIDVTERIAVAVVPAGERWVLIDDEGVVFQTLPSRPTHLPQVKLGSPGPEDPSTRAALRVLVTLTPDLRTKMTALVAESTTRIRLELNGGRTVVWGDAEESETKARVATALLSRPGKVIDVSAPDVVTVR